ncbi:ergothioneine biosynthesis protein EgtB [Legionella fairfieldensis]|uniref:ergothioneine biosynthesis protein EgtB n=1 Tax=Legionella fairfieldensis TaxID=45064 RepID=UPI00048FB14E|nr:ergothioneine biosynthesis protein EgtB [Legionella fairfieldensis]
MKRKKLIQAFETIRQQTERLCQPLVIEDYVIQSIEEVSPPKWHLAHTSWFFETFILTRQFPKYNVFHSSFHHLFNSYYQSIGTPYPRARRGLLSRPTVELVYSYRQYIDNHILALLEQVSDTDFIKLNRLITLGLHHEQQHQELLLMDIKHNFSFNPDFPAYHSPPNLPAHRQYKSDFSEIKGGIVTIGHSGKTFCFDNELPCHKTFLRPFSLANQLVSNGDYLEFIEAGGYQQPCWWLADGWECVLRNQWRAPLYWYHVANEWQIFTLHGLTAINPSEPVSHVSYYEADAYARWRKARLPTEEEWEHFVISRNLSPEKGNFMETRLYHPQSAVSDENDPQQFFGDLWEWTASAYSPYPGYQPLNGALGEYNSKFMANQMVLRGGCCVSAQSHLRASYRNFFQPDKRWQFSGIRLAN